MQKFLPFETNVLFYQRFFSLKTNTPFTPNNITVVYSKLTGLTFFNKTAAKHIFRCESEMGYAFCHNDFE